MLAQALHPPLTFQRSAASTVKTSSPTNSPPQGWHSAALCEASHGLHVSPWPPTGIPSPCIRQRAQPRSKHQHILSPGPILSPSYPMALLFSSVWCFTSGSHVLALRALRALSQRLHALRALSQRLHAPWIARTQLSTKSSQTCDSVGGRTLLRGGCLK